MLLLEYSNGPSHHVAMQHLLHPGVPVAARAAINQTFALWVIVLLCATYTAYVAQSIAFMIVFLLFLLSRIHDWATYSRRYWAAIETSMHTMPVKHIRLQVRETGLHETVGGIESFAPWASVKSFIMFREILFVQLAVGLWAMIPKETLSSTSSSVEELATILNERGVPESREARPVTAEDQPQAAVH